MFLKLTSSLLAPLCLFAPLAKHTADICCQLVANELSSSDATHSLFTVTSSEVDVGGHFTASFKGLNTFLQDLCLKTLSNTHIHTLFFVLYLFTTCFKFYFFLWFYYPALPGHSGTSKKDLLVIIPASSALFIKDALPSLGLPSWLLIK